MISDADRQLLASVNECLAKGMNVSQAARELGIPKAQLFSRIYRLGLRIESQTRLVSVNALDEAAA